MKPTFLVPCLMLAACVAAPDAVADSTAPSARAPALASAPTPTPTPASAPVRATRAASAACAPLGASGPMRGHRLTSKVRHIPDESDPCADSTGVKPSLPR